MWCAKPSGWGQLDFPQVPQAARSSSSLSLLGRLQGAQFLSPPPTPQSFTRIREGDHLNSTVLLRSSSRALSLLRCITKHSLLFLTEFSYLHHVNCSLPHSSQSCKIHPVHGLCSCPGDRLLQGLPPAGCAANTGPVLGGTPSCEKPCHRTPHTGGRPPL